MPMEGIINASSSRAADGSYEKDMSVEFDTSKHHGSFSHERDASMNDIAGLMALMQGNMTKDLPGMLALCKERGYACIFVGEHEAWVCQPSDELRQIFYNFLGVKEFPIVDFDEALSHEIYQLTPFFSPEDELTIAPQMPQSEFGRWYHSFVDITAKGNTKQNGIDEFIKHFGFKLEETMAFGDGGNDIGMLRHAGVGIAMGNAKDDVKASADYVTASVDEDGIFKALKHFEII